MRGAGCRVQGAGWGCAACSSASCCRGARVQCEALTPARAVLVGGRRYAAGVGADGQHSGAVAKLPDWIRQSLVGCKGFGEAYGRVARFFKGIAAAELAEARPAGPGGA